MSRIERLLNLSAALLSAERPLRAEELRERIAGYPEDKASFRRQFERDKEALRELGLPLETIVERRANEEVVAYRVNAENYYIRDPGLEPDELSALHLAARLVQIEGLDAASGLWKLDAASQTDKRRKGSGPSVAASPEPTIEGGQDGPAASLPADERLTELFGVLASGASVRFQFKGETRHVQPRRLSFSRAHWYLQAYDIGRDAERSFRLDRIDGSLATSEAVLPPAPSNSVGASAFARPWELGDIGTGESATVLVDAEQAPWAIRSVGADAMTRRRSDGAVELSLMVRNLEAFRTFVLGFLHHAEVLAPAHLRDDIVTWLADLADEPQTAGGKR